MGGGGGGEEGNQKNANATLSHDGVWSEKVYVGSSNCSGRNWMPKGGGGKCLWGRRSLKRKKEKETGPKKKKSRKKSRIQARDLDGFLTLGHEKPIKRRRKGKKLDNQGTWKKKHRRRNMLN